MEEFIHGQQCSNYVQNHSTAKQMYSFGKAKRFFDTSVSYNSFRKHTMYTLPPTLSTRSTTFGYGDKYDITLLNNSKERLKIRVPYYIVPSDKLSHQTTAPKYSFGLSRDVFQKVVIDNQLSMPNVSSPGPAVYDTRNVPGHDCPRYSFGEKIKFKGKGYILNVPGPGNYNSTYTEINKDGKYPISTFSNTKDVNWSKAKEKRFFNLKNSKTPGPGMYEIHGLVNGSGRVYNSKFKSGTAKTMGSKLKGVFDRQTKGDTPGPGAYSTFSEFGFVRYGYERPQGRNKSMMRTEYGNFGHRPNLTSRSSIDSSMRNSTIVRKQTMDK